MLAFLTRTSYMTCSSAGLWEAGDGTIWRSLKPHDMPSRSSVSTPLSRTSGMAVAKQMPPERPRIWAAVSYL